MTIISVKEKCLSPIEFPRIETNESHVHENRPSTRIPFSFALNAVTKKMVLNGDL